MSASASTNPHQNQTRQEKNEVLTNSRYLLITSDGIFDTKDILRQRLENYLNKKNPVEKIVYGNRSDKVVVIFRDKVSPIFLEGCFKKQSLNYKIEAIKEPTVVQVLNIQKGSKSLQAVKLYFSNTTESGGTKEADFYNTPDPTSGYCLIDLKDPKVVKRVSERKHDNLKKGIYILPFYEGIGVAVNLEENPNDQLADKVVLQGIDSEMKKFIDETMERELQNFMRKYRLTLAGSTLNSVTFIPTLSEDSSASSDPAVVYGADWKSRVQQTFTKDFLEQIHVERLEINDKRKWKYIQEMKDELCRQAPAVKIYDESSPPTFKLVCRKTDEQALKSLIDRIESIEPPEEPVIDNMQGYSSLKLKAFEILGFREEIERKNQVSLQILANDGKIEVIGIPINIKAAKAKIAEILGSLEEKTCPPPNEDYLEILNSPQLKEQCDREIKKENLRAFWEIISDGSNKKLLICYKEATQKSTFKELTELILGCVATEAIDIDRNVDQESQGGLKTKIKEIENYVAPFARIMYLEHSNNIRITCRKDLMARCKQQLHDFINANCILTCEIYMSAAIAEYIYDVMKPEIDRNVSAFGKPFEWKFKDSKFYVTGNQTVLSKCKNVLHQLASTVIVTWKSIERRGIQKYFTSGAGKHTDLHVDRCHLKILGKDDFQKSKIRSIVLTDDGQSIAIGSMDLYKLPVDGLVNEMNKDCEPFSRGGEELKREISDYFKANEKMTEGHVHTTGPGKLPYLKILHAVVPKWRGGTEKEDTILEETIESILSTAEALSLRSLAVPMMACRTLFGYPIRRASAILLNTIVKRCPTRFKFIREIYICDTDTTKIQTFQRQAENLFRSQCLTIPLGQNLTFGKTVAQKPDKKTQKGFKTIVQRRGIRKIPLPAGRKIIIAWGDLAILSNCNPPLKADIIVNPTTSFPDLSGAIANGLKAASSNGGMFDLETECKKKEPNGGLQKGSYVATETPHMSCDQILHLRIEEDYTNINEETLKQYIKSCMNYALMEEKSSIAFPTIGTENLGYPRDVVTKCFAHTISEFSQAQTSGSLKEVIIVIYHRDYETTMAFEDKLQRLLAKRPHRLIANIEEELMEEEDKDEEKKKEKNDGKRSDSTYRHSPFPASSIRQEAYLLQNGCSVTLKHGSLENSGAMALVSPTSSIPRLNGVIPSAIKKAAGGTIIEDELNRNSGNVVKKGEIAITGAGNISGCKKVYHLKLEDFNAQKGSQASLIYNSVKLCLKQADKDGVSSIAFPTIGTGGFKWPPQLVADETFQAVKSFTNSRQSSGPPLQIIIMIFSQNNPENLVFQTTAKNQLDKGVTLQTNLDDDQAATVTYSNMKVELLPGKLEDSKADVIVCTTSSFPNLNGAIANALSKVAGRSLQADCNKNYPKGLQDAQIASTCGGSLNCRKVFHIKLSEWNHNNGISVVQNSVTECLNMLQSEGLQSINFPTIGTGGFKYPAKDVASAMFTAFKLFCQKNPGYRFYVTIVLFPETKDVSQVFNNTLIQTFKDAQKGGQRRKQNVKFAENVNYDQTDFSEETTYIDPEKRDFVLLKLISDSKDMTDKAFLKIRKQVDRVFTQHEPLKNDVIGKMRKCDIQEVEMICKKLDVEIEIFKQDNTMVFEGTAENVRNANEQILKVLKAINDRLQSETVGNMMEQYYEWCYEEKEHILIPYSKKTGIELEMAFRKGDKTFEFTDTDDRKYCVNFTENVEAEVGNGANTVTVVRLDRMIGDMQPFPDTWDKKDKKNLEIVTLQSTDQEYSDVESNFKRTIGRFKLKTIHNIKRIQNPTQYQQYALKKRFMQTQHPNISVEMALWHGTALDNVDKINLNGFNRSYAGNTFGTVWYGTGVYFSTKSEYGCNDKYAKKDAMSHKYMYQCKVLTGNSTVVQKGYDKRYPPDDPATGVKYDSTSSPNKDEYVIYNDTQSYPEYLIEFE